MKKEEDEQLKDLRTEKIEEEEEADQNEEDLLMECLDEMLESFDHSRKEISDWLSPHIANDEIILTFGFSQLLLDCFKEGKKDKKYELSEAESGCWCCRT